MVPSRFAFGFAMMTYSLSGPGAESRVENEVYKMDQPVYFETEGIKTFFISLSLNFDFQNSLNFPQADQISCSFLSLANLELSLLKWHDFKASNS